MKLFNEDYRLKKMAKMVEGENVLDIGCSEKPNPFLNAENLVGFDLNDGILSSNYVRIVVGNVYDLPNPFKDFKFDTIVIGEVIEHVNNPVLFLEKCMTLLNKGGKIVLSTPNPNSPIERLLTLTLNRRFFYTKDHVILYPQRWLIRIMENAGLEGVELYSGGIPFPFFGLIPFTRAHCYQTIAVGYKR